MQISFEEAVKKVQADIRSSLCADRKETLQTVPSPVSLPSTSTSSVADDTGGQKDAKLFVPFVTGALGVSAPEAYSIMTDPKNQDSFQKMFSTISNAMQSFIRSLDLPPASTTHQSISETSDSGECNDVVFEQSSRSNDVLNNILASHSVDQPPSNVTNAFKTHCLSPINECLKGFQHPFFHDKGLVKAD